MRRPFMLLLLIGGVVSGCVYHPPVHHYPYPSPSAPAPTVDFYNPCPPGLVSDARQTGYRRDVTVDARERYETWSDRERSTVRCVHPAYHERR